MQFTHGSMCTFLGNLNMRLKEHDKEEEMLTEDGWMD